QAFLCPLPPRLGRKQTPASLGAQRQPLLATGRSGHDGDPPLAREPLHVSGNGRLVEREQAAQRRLVRRSHLLEREQDGELRLPGPALAHLAVVELRQRTRALPRRGARADELRLVHCDPSSTRSGVSGVSAMYSNVAMPAFSNGRSAVTFFASSTLVTFRMK